MATSDGFKGVVLECLNTAECGGEFSFFRVEMFLQILQSIKAKCFFHNV